MHFFCILNALFCIVSALLSFKCILLHFNCILLHYKCIRRLFRSFLPQFECILSVFFCILGAVFCILLALLLTEPESESFFNLTNCLANSVLSPFGSGFSMANTTQLAMMVKSTVYSKGGHSIKNLVARRKKLVSLKMKSDVGPSFLSSNFFFLAILELECRCRCRIRGEEGVEGLGGEGGRLLGGEKPESPN